MTDMRYACPRSGRCARCEREQPVLPIAWRAAQQYCFSCWYLLGYDARVWLQGSVPPGHPPTLHPDYTTPERPVYQCEECGLWSTAITWVARCRAWLCAWCGRAWRDA